MISVLVGCTFTSTLCGSTSRKMKYAGTAVSGMRPSYAFITALWRYALLKKRPFTKRYWLPGVFFAVSGRPTKPLTLATLDSAPMSTISEIIFPPSRFNILYFRDFSFFRT